MDIEYNCPHCKTKSSGNISEFTIGCDSKLKKLAELREKEYKTSETEYIATLKEFRAIVAVKNKHRTLFEKVLGVHWHIEYDKQSQKYLLLKRNDEIIEYENFSKINCYETNYYNYIQCPVCNRSKMIP